MAETMTIAFFVVYSVDRNGWRGYQRSAVCGLLILASETLKGANRYDSSLDP